MKRKKITLAMKQETRLSILEQERIKKEQARKKKARKLNRVLNGQNR